MARYLADNILKLFKKPVLFELGKLNLAQFYHSLKFWDLSYVGQSWDGLSWDDHTPHTSESLFHFDLEFRAQSGLFLLHGPCFLILEVIPIHKYV